MARFYGQVEGMASTRGTRRGGGNVRVSAQSWNGSIITELYYNSNGVLCVRVETSSGSDFYGYKIFEGTFEDYEKILKGEK